MDIKNTKFYKNKSENNSLIGKNKQAVVVDDHTNMRIMMGNICRQLGYKIIPLNDGFNLIDTLNNERNVGLVLCDWNMPRVPGITVVEELAEEIEKNPDFVTPIFMMVTAQNYINEVMRAGENISIINGYIVKPLTINKVITKILKAEEKQKRKRIIEGMKWRGVNKYGEDHPERFKDAIKACFEEYDIINNEQVKKSSENRKLVIKQMEEQLEKIKKSIARFKNDEEKEKFFEKLERLRSSKSSQSKLIIWPLLEASRMVVDCGDFIRAFQILDDLEKKTGSAWVMAEKGRIFELKGNNLMAIREYSKAITVNPKFIFVRDKLANLLKGKNDLKEAFKITKEASTISPDSPNRRRLEGNLAMDLEEYEEAEEVFKHILTIEKAKHTVLNNVNMGRALLAQPEKVDDAREYLNKAEQAINYKREKPKSGTKRSLFLNYGDYYLKKNDDTSAEKWLSYGINKVVNDPDDKTDQKNTIAEVGDIYIKNNRVNQAAKLLLTMLEEDPKNKIRQKIVKDLFEKHNKEKIAEDLIKKSMDLMFEKIFKINNENLKKKRQALLLVKEKQYHKAEILFLETLDTYNDLIIQYPSDEGLWFNKGMLLKQMIDNLGKDYLSQDIISKYSKGYIASFKEAYRLDPERISEGLKKIKFPLEEILK